MSVVRVLAVLPLITVLTGCMIEDLKSDVRMLKGDIIALKAYLARTHLPDECKMPGDQDSSKICTYKLKITDDSRSAHGIYKAVIHPDVYKTNAENCPKIVFVEEYKSLKYDCPPLVDAQGKPTDFSKRSHWYPDTEIEYTIQVDGHPALIAGDDPVELESISGSKHLKKK